MSASLGTKLDRTQLAAFKPVLSGAEIDALIEAGGSVQFGSADFHFLKTMDFSKGVPVEKVEVKEKDKPPLERQISERLLAGKTLKPATAGTGRRTFFRTWISAIPRSQAL
jgi:hypothetical protein